ncbi:hypothetical protein WG66_004058 [Moniliophthora roreri]|nr:hypothetical protein WG66_004058 [Moniliophthora roreri]
MNYRHIIPFYQAGQGAQGLSFTIFVSRNIQNSTMAVGIFAIIAVIVKAKWQNYASAYQSSAQ